MHPTAISTLIVLFLASLCLVSCSERPESESSPPASPAREQDAPRDYRSTGDLKVIKEHGVLRLIAPHFDGAESLSQAGIPVLAYQAIAEELAASLGVAVRWHYVNGFAELLPALEAGKGDLIVTNLTVTPERASRVSFTTPINKVSEVVIAPKDSALKSAADLADASIAVPAGSAYLSSLKEKDVPMDAIAVLSTAHGDSDRMTAVAEGLYDATVLDSDVARALVPAYPDLTTAFTLKSRRDIAWAVRQNNPELLKAVNEFLVAHHVQVSVHDASQRTWQEIKKLGHLRMLTTNNPASYFMYRGELMGFDYDLLKHFANQHDLYLSVVVKDNLGELFTALKQGEGDVIAASVTHTPLREQAGLIFSRPYLKVTEQLVGLESGPRTTSVEQLAGYAVGVNPSTSFFQTLKKLQQGLEQPFNLIELPGMSTESIIAQLEEGEFEFAVADSHLVAMEQTYHKNIVVNIDLTEKRNIAWVLRPNQESLADALNAFIQKHHRGLIYNMTYNKYFRNAKQIHKLQEGRVATGAALSPYDDIVKRIAREYGMDWRLIVAQMYQESQFDPEAESFAGAQGLMQLMPRTAKELGYKDLHKPEIAIRAGIEYMNWLQDRFPYELEFEDRLYFTLAAYNVGAGHVRDARRLARQQSLDPDKWFGHVEKAMLMLSDPQYYKKSRFGYVRGREPVAYVRDIRDRYVAYLNVKQ